MFNFIELPTPDKAILLIEMGDLLATNCYLNYNILLYHYDNQFWELVWDNQAKAVVMVRKAKLQQYLDSISIKELFI